MAAASPKKTTVKSRRRKSTTAQSAAAHWLRVGAVGLGLGAAVTVGQGTAAAAPDDGAQSGTQASATHGNAAKSGRTGATTPRRAKTGPAPDSPAVGKPDRNGPNARLSVTTPRADSQPATVAVTPARIANLLTTGLPAPTALRNAATLPVPAPPAVFDIVGSLPAPVRAAAESAPAAVDNALTGMARIRLGQLPSGLPLPASPVGALFAAVSGAVREVELAFVRHSAVGPVVTTSLDNAEPEVAPTRVTQPAAAAGTLTEAEREQSQAEINMKLGWVPVLGTAFNALSLVSDFLGFTVAALSGDTADMGDELRDMAVDLVGMIPIVGGPLAATLHYALVAASAPPNHAPIAVTDNFGVNQNTQLTGNVKANDTDADGDPLSVAVAAGPAHGSLTLNADGSFTYNPATNYSGADGFTYTVSDGKGGQATGTANITVNYVAPPPSTPTLSQQVAAFVGTTKGRTIANPDGSYAGECVSLVRQYLEQVFNIRTGAWGNAIDYRSGSSGGNQLAARGFTWHTDRNFQDGDILVFGQSSQGGTSAYGHIGIWNSGQFYDQNDGWRANARTANYSPFDNSAPYTDRGVSAAFLGYWRAPAGSTG
ncbi:Ig-like domain-containing protein, partial [Mycobacterium sp. shizuoka-1]|uniref:Ig-like domain-containing protein n=1 Tax=Mycobacterium sp. shizuoka-1 TaxID=2039281 RepID=UPI000C07A24A